jgi:hypothetical protein
MMHMTTIGIVVLMLVAGCSSSPYPNQPSMPDSTTIVLDNAKVSDARQAEAVAIQALYKMTERYGARDARARIRSRPSFVAEADVPDFATKGDRIWPVQEIWFMETVCLVWVNADNGKVKIVNMKAESEQTPAGDVLKAAPEK